MAGAGTRARERVPTIAELKENGYQNVKQTEIDGKTYLIAVKDSVQVDLDSFIGTADLRTWVIQNMSSVRVFQTNAQGRITRELNRRDISELPIPEEAPAEAAHAPAEAPAAERLRLGKDTDVRTRQIIRALESGNYEGITFPGTAGARAEFFQQFSGQEKAFLQRAWDFATPKERELFAAELNAFFAEAGDGRMGMMTAAKILQRMASDYLSHQGAYAQARFFTITDFYYYASDIMAEEKTAGGAREHSIGSIGGAMRRAVHGRYIRLVDELKEERRSAIIRRLPGLEQIPTPAEGAEVEATPTEAAPAEAATAAQVEAAPAAAEQMQPPSALDRMYARYSQVEFYQQMISRLPAGSPQLPNMQASLRAAEDSFLEFVQAQPQDIQDSARARVRAINDRRAAELSAPVAATPAQVAPAEEAPVEEAPAESATAAPVEVYDYAKIHQISDRINTLIPETYSLSDPGIFDIPDFGEEVHGLYKELQAHFADFDRLIAGGTLTAEQATFLNNMKAIINAALAVE